MTHNVIKLTIEHESAVDLFLFQISAYIAKQSSGITSPRLFKFLRHILKSVINGEKTSEEKDFSKPLSPTASRDNLGFPEILFRVPLLIFA